MKFLPLICFAFCITVVVTKAPNHVLVLAASLYCLASISTVHFYLAYKSSSPFGKRTIKSRLPHIVYEYIPFVYGAFSLTLIYFSQHESITLAAVGLMVLATRHILCRFHNRVFQPTTL